MQLNQVQIHKAVAGEWSWGNVTLQLAKLDGGHLTAEQVARAAEISWHLQVQWKPS